MRTFVVAPLLLIAATVPVAAACWRLSEAFVHSRLARLALAWFLATAQITITLQILGILALWNPAAQLVAAWLGSAALWALARRLGAPAMSPEDEPEAPRADSVARWVRCVIVAGPVAIGVAALVTALVAPDTGNDAMLYHRQMLAHWLRSGTLWRIPALESSVSYEGGYWSNGDLFSLWTAIPYGRDWLAQLSSLFWAAGAWLAITSAARTFGLGTWTSALAGSATVVTFAVLGGQLAIMHVDVYTVATAAVMVWASWRWMSQGRPGGSLGSLGSLAAPGGSLLVDGRTRWLAIAGLGAGLAVGSKLFAIFFCGLWCLVVFVSALRQKRHLAGVALLLAAAAPIIVWPLRALVVHGQPFWPIGFGPFAAPAAPTENGLRSIIGLARTESAAAVVAMLVIGLIIGYGLIVPVLMLNARPVCAWCRDRCAVILGLIVPAVGFLAWIASPGTGQFLGQVVITQRFYAPVMTVVTLVVAAATLGPGGRRTRRNQSAFAVSVIFGAVVIFGFHSLLTFAWPLWARLTGIAAGLVVGWVATGARVPWSWPTRTSVFAGIATTSVVAVVLLAAPLKASNWYPRQAYLAWMAPVFDWMQSADVRDANIAYAGVYSSALAGPDASNHAFWLGKPAPQGGMTVWDDQAAWEAALAAACVDYVVVGAPADKTPPQSKGMGAQVRVDWGRELPEWDWAPQSNVLRPVVKGDDIAVYAVNRNSSRAGGCVTPG